MTRTFLDEVQHMSLWEVAHRWAGVHPDATNERKLPLEVKDILFSMMRAQLESRLKVAMADGYIFRDATFYRHWTEFQPFSDQNWDGSEEHRRTLYFQATDANLVRHDKFIHQHHDVISGKKSPQRKYLSSVHVDRQNTAEWALLEELPFPQFWFSQAEREEIEKEYQTYKPFLELIADHHRQGKAVTDEMEEQFLRQLEIENLDDENIGHYRKPKLKEEDIDHIWEVRMLDKQKARILCRHAAKYLWSKNPDRTIVDISADSLLQDYCDGRSFPGKDTIRNWIKDLDPRDPENRIGRPRKK